jgi:PhoD-like phosphatase
MKIVFTSCMDAVRVPVQPVWGKIAEEKNVDVLMLIGDQIYMDWGDLGASNWKQFIERNQTRGLEAFTTEMHHRYALQWEVPEFQKLICNFAGRADVSRLLLTWDDHDFAWNNALGVDGKAGDLSKHGVPPEVKAVSYRLFKQFEAQLRTAGVGAEYPALPVDWGSPLVPAIEQGLFWQGALARNGVQCLLLDTRWHREARATNPANSASILGQAQSAALMAAASQECAGLLLVVAGTPMAHDYLASPQAWANGPTSYAEYNQLLTNAKRPILFLGGDIHRNAWGGSLTTTQGVSSSVVQVLSSGAAVGKLGFKRIAPSYGVIDVPASFYVGGNVDVQLTSLDTANQKFENPRIGRLGFTATNWIEPVQGEAQARVEARADSEPLTVLCARTRDAHHRATSNYPAVNEELDDFDALYNDQPFGATPQQGVDPLQHPEPLLLTAAQGTKPCLKFMGNINQGDQRPKEIEDAIRAAFVRAKEAGKLSVVLFIHGIGKTFSASLAQAYQLRSTFPMCEPILYSWQAGGSGSALAALQSVPTAVQSAKDGAFSLYTVLKAFGKISAEVAFNNLTKVIVARSAGSIALHQALLRASPNFNGQLASVNRIVLSSPLLKGSNFKDNSSYASLQMPVIFTRNSNDQTLKFANWIDGFGPILGLSYNWTPRANCYCIDFTHSARVGRLHDYLLLQLNPHQMQLNQRLLTDAHFDPAQAVTSGLLSRVDDSIFNAS